MSSPPPVPPKPPSRLAETLFAAVTRSAGMSVLACVVTLIAVLTVQAWPAFAGAGQNGLVTSTNWQPTPTEAHPTPSFGSLAFVYGTLVTSAIAMLVAVPLGVGSAAFLSEIAPAWVRKAGMFLIELLAAIPSVVYGFWGLTMLAPAVAWFLTLAGGEERRDATGILAAGLVLAVMVLPYITAISFDVIRSVPRISREGSLALGASRWQTIWGVVLPTARPGIVAASFLALGRALGETMAVIMLIGNVAAVQDPVYGKGDTIASRIAGSIAEASDPDARSAIIALALVLFAVTAVTNLLARLILSGLTRPRKAAPPAETEATVKGALPEPPPGYVPRQSHAALWNRVMTALLGLGTVVTVVPLFLIFGLIMVRGTAAVTDPNLFTERARANLTDEQFEQYQAFRRGETTEPPKTAAGRPIKRGGLGPHMLGSLIMVGGATLVAVPIGLLAAVWLAEARRSWLANLVRGVTELLGGVPSVVIGLFVYSVLCAPSYGMGEPLNASAWAGMAALGLLMTPVVVRSAEESMRLVPDPLREASYALGANRMQTTLRVIVPAALPAIITGIFLAIGRIAGETAPLLFTAQQNQELPTRRLYPDDPDPEKRKVEVLTLWGRYPFLTGKINEYATSPFADYKDQAWGATLVLMGVVMALNVGIRLAAGKRVVAASAGG